MTQPQSQRAAYEPPAIRDLGSLADMTQGGIGVDNMDNGGNMNSRIP